MILEFADTVFAWSWFTPDDQCFYGEGVTIPLTYSARFRTGKPVRASFGSYPTGTSTAPVLDLLKKNIVLCRLFFIVTCLLCSQYCTPFLLVIEKPTV